MAISKVIYGGRTLIDLTADTLTPDKALAGYTFHGPDGEEKEGTCAFDVDSSGATAAVAEVLAGKTFGAKGKINTGTMKNNGAVTVKITDKAQKANIAQGYHDGSGTAEIDATEQAKLVPENIREGITILGVEGTMSGSEDSKPQAKTVTPSTEAQTVIPDSGYNCLSQVTVAAIPYEETDNSAGGKTVTIG
ncbi:MAG: hypothetical protein IJ418_01855 [Clostridia bacterium]|nr:hypothetical protein [Clostridia bacterium]MBQ8616234.1 hypothetical protein [Clostridia bacterium]